MIQTEWVCELCGMTERPCLCASAGKRAVLTYEKEARKRQKLADRSKAMDMINDLYKKLRGEK